MNELAAAWFLIPLVDQALKFLLRRVLGTGSVPLGPLGNVRVVRAQIWWARPRMRPNLALIWGLWLLSAGTLVLLTTRIPSCGWCAGLLLGGSLSHLLETSLRGCVTDYVCLRFWPAFNLADLAITVGAVGTGLKAFLAVRQVFP